MRQSRVAYLHFHQDGSLCELCAGHIVLEIIGTRNDWSYGAEMKPNSARGRGGKDAGEAGRNSFSSAQPYAP